MSNRCPLKQPVRILGLPRTLLRKADFVFLMKAQNTRKKILSKLFFVYMYHVRVGARCALQYLILLISINNLGII